MASRTVTVTIYRDARGEWRWAIRAANGRIIGDSGEGYERKAACLRMARKIAATHEPWPVVEEPA